MSDAGRCPVCGVGFHDRAVHCARCGAPHHRDCWEYLGGCAIFGCTRPADWTPCSQPRCEPLLYHRFRQWYERVNCCLGSFLVPHFLSMSPNAPPLWLITPVVFGSLYFCSPFPPRFVGLCLLLYGAGIAVAATASPLRDVLLGAGWGCAIALQAADTLWSTHESLRAG